MGVMDIRRRILMDAPQLYAASGAVASFKTNMAAPLAECKTEFAPVQSGSGDPSPSNVRPITGWTGVTVNRCGKNMMDGAAFAALVASKGGTLDTQNKTISYTGAIASQVGTIMDKFEEGQYTVIAKFTNNTTTAANNMDMRIVTDKGSMNLAADVATYSADGWYAFISKANENVVRLECNWISGTATVYYETFGVFKGVLTLAEFEEYIGNTYPVTFPALGANQWDEEWELGQLNTRTGENVSSPSQIRAKGYIPVIGGNTYYMNTGGTTVWMLFYDSSKNVLSNNLPAGGGSSNNARAFINATITMPNDCSFVRFYCVAGYGTTYKNDIALNYPATVTAYEPFTNTVYGGYLDLATGQLVATYAKTTLDGSVSVGITNWMPTQGHSAWLYRNTVIPSNTDAVSSSRNKVLCNKYPTKKYTDLYMGNDGVSIDIGSATQWGLVIRIPVEGLSTDNAIYAYLAENPIDVVYELATPITYQLTPVQIKALLGQNNIFSNAGDCEVKYWKH